MQNVPARGASVYLIDGTSFCYRAFYAIRSLSNSKGEATNAIYGFITMMRKLIKDRSPDYLAICFDRKEPTFRHEKFKDYKAHRKPMPDELVEQLEPIKAFCRAYRYAIFEKAGFEADDVLGTLACRAREKQCNVFIVTGDKDALQLVDEKIRVLNPHKEDLVLDAEAVRGRFEGLGPDKVVDIMALMGDASDNIPGVSGIGEKTAVKLIREFGSVENLLKQAGRISSKAQQEKIKNHEKDALLSKELATIDTKVPVEVDWEKMRIADPDQEALMDLLKRYEFRTLLKEQVPAGSEQEEKRAYVTLSDEKEFSAWVRQLEKEKAFSFDTETTSSDPMRAELVGMSFSWEPFKAYYVPVSSSKHSGPGLGLEKVLGRLRPVLEDGGLAKFGQNLKYDRIVMKRHGVELRGIEFDTMIASYLVNPIKPNHNLDDIAMEYLGIRKIPTESLIGTGKSRITMDAVPLEKIAAYACEDADCVWRLVPVLRERLRALGIEKLFREIEMPLAEVLAGMEMSGVNLNLKFLKELSEKASDELKTLTREIYREAGEEFNINSTQQLAEILFVKMRIPPVKRTKTGYSTDVDVLEKLALAHELPKKILEYRERAKLKSTYLDALPEMLNPGTGRVHTSYHQATTATGRLSSSDPNLQNIPVKTDAGRQIRRAFVSRFGGGKILSADYSQIELRILAHLAGDENLRKAFKEDRDIHRFTATLLYGVKEGDVTRPMRDVAKTINFSIIYGKTPYGLSQDLGISVGEAEGFIENYFRRYRSVKEYLESQKEKARQDGYLTTILGRRSYFPDIRSKNAQVRQFAERAAINAPIQGSAADLIKIAMIAIGKRFGAGDFESVMIMQVHDELVFDVRAGERERVGAVVREEMEGAYPLEVPLKVDMTEGESWYKN